MNNEYTSENDHDGEFLWLVSLSDLMMLLFVFFVVLFSFSYKKMESTDLKRMNSLIKGEGTTNAIDPIQKKLLNWAVKKDLMDDIDIVQKEDSLIIQIKEKILFSPGQSKLQGSAFEITSLIGRALKRIPKPYRIGIEGHTDNRPFSKDGFDGNWDLSSERALSVLKSLNLDTETLSRVVLMAYGQNRPRVPNSNEKNQALNRRVTIRVF